jgi:hypothetical protein
VQLLKPGPPQQQRGTMLTSLITASAPSPALLMPWE